MSLLRNITSGLRSLFRRDQVDRELDEELGAYLEMEAAEKMKQGVSRKDALRAVRLERGSLELAREVVRSGNWEFFVETCWQDFRFGLRTLRKSPGFTAVAVLTLALGIGANTAIFSLMDSVMLSNLPVKDPKQLVHFSWASPKWPKVVQMISGSESMGSDESGRTFASSFSYPVFERFASDKTYFSSLFGFYDLEEVNINVRGMAVLARGEIVTAGFFSGLGVEPILGRAIATDDENPGSAAVAVISWKFWRAHFSGDRNALGQSIAVNNVPFSIVGVAPPEFFGVDPRFEIDVWVPAGQMSALTIQNGTTSFTRRDAWWISVMGRLRPGGTQQQARSALDSILAQESTYDVKPAPKPDEIPHLELSSGAKGLDSLRTQFSEPLHLLFAAVGLVLLIACANVAGILLARSTARTREICVRSAMGAGRARLTRQLFAESVLLALAGGCSGVLLADWGSRILFAMASPPGHVLPIKVGIDPLVLLFTLAVSIATAVLFGLMPALRATRVDLVPGLKENWANLPNPSLPRLHSRKVLVVVETALSLVLLISAGLFVRTLGNLESQDLGFHSDRVLLFALDPSRQDYKGQRAVHFYEDLLGRIRALPAVESASLSTHVLLSGGGSFFNGFAAEGNGTNPHTKLGVHVDWVSPGFLQTMRIPLLAGRNFGPQDNSGSQPAVLISQTMARQFFGDEDPLGKWLHHDDLPSKVTVVGVVKDVKYSSADEDDLADVYVPYLQQSRGLGAMNVEIRAHVDPLSLVPQVRELVAQIDRNIPISDVRTQEEQVSESLLQQRLFARLSSFFGLLALLLVWVGLYGLVAYAVTQRTHEIGIRIALGAPREDILKLVVGQGLKVTLIGVGIGVVVAFVLTRFVSSLLYDVKPADPVTFGAVSLILTAVALLASYLPARRATKVDPMVALRYE